MGGKYIHLQCQEVVLIIILFQKNPVLEVQVPVVVVPVEVLLVAVEEALVVLAVLAAEKLAEVHQDLAEVAVVMEVAVLEVAMEAADLEEVAVLAEVAPTEAVALEVAVPAEVVPVAENHPAVVVLGQVRAEVQEAASLGAVGLAFLVALYQR